MPTLGDLAVEVVADPGQHQDDQREHVVLGQDRPEEDRHADQPQHRQHVGERQDAVGHAGSPTTFPVLLVLTRWQPNGQPHVEFAGMDNPLVGPGWSGCASAAASSGGSTTRTSCRYGWPRWTSCGPSPSSGPWLTPWRAATPATRGRRTTRRRSRRSPRALGLGARPRHDGDRPRRDAGVVEVLKLITDPGAPVAGRLPVDPPFFQFVTHLGHPVVEAPLGEDGRLDLGTWSGPSPRRPWPVAARHTCCPTQEPDRCGAHARELTAALGWRRRPASGWSPTRSTRRSCTPRRPSPRWRRCPRAPGRSRRCRPRGVQPRRAQGGDGGARSGGGCRPGPHAGGGVPRREPPG